MFIKRILIILLLTTALLGLGYYLNNQIIIHNSVTKNNGDYVVLLHGLGRSSFSMQKMGVELAQEGYKVININYPSRKDTIENLVNNNLKNELSSKCTDEDKKINFVTHSMGGIMVRYLLANNDIKNVDKVVMLAPPNKGSGLADKLCDNQIANLALGPSLKELTTDQNSLVNTLDPIGCKVGVIAGEHDGKVSVENTRLDEMSDFIIFPKTHTWIMYDKQIIHSVINFLNQGRF